MIIASSLAKLLNCPKRTNITIKYCNYLEMNINMLYSVQDQNVLSFLLLRCSRSSFFVSSFFYQKARFDLYLAFIVNNEEKDDFVYLDSLY